MRQRVNDDSSLSLSLSLSFCVATFKTTNMRVLVDVDGRKRRETDRERERERESEREEEEEEEEEEGETGGGEVCGRRVLTRVECVYCLIDSIPKPSLFDASVRRREDELGDRESLLAKHDRLC